MKKHSKYKKQSLAVIVACSVMTISGVEVFAENSTQSSLSKTEVSTNIQQEHQSDTLENRVFEVKGKGDVQILRSKERKQFSFSPYEPTGLYAKPNEKITIYVEGNQNIQAYIGTCSYDGAWNEDYKIRSFTLVPGTNTIESPYGGMIYFYNEQQGSIIQTRVTKGGSATPYFELEKHTKQDLITMLNQYPDAHAVELKGERVLITASPARVKKYLLGSNTDPVQLLRKMDEATRIQDKISGLSEEQVDKHYVHYVEDNHGEGYMYAFPHRTAYIGDAIQHVLDFDKFTNDGWGPWHEAGHLRQQEPWKFHNMTEVQVNLYSLAVEKAFGHPSRLEIEKDNNKTGYERAFEYLDKPDIDKDYDKIEDLFVKLVMLWQLHLAYGEEFYPTLHQQYRDMPNNELPTTDEYKKQLFMIEASKAAQQNLLPFFEQWGLKPNQDTIQKITQLGYQILVDPIWKSTDSNPVKPSNEVLAPPTDLHALGTTVTSVDLKWTAPTGNIQADYYEIYRNGKRIHANVTDTRVIDSGLQPDTSYTYEVKAVTTTGKVSEASNTLHVKTKEKEHEAPTPPTNLQAMDITENSIGIQWSSSTSNSGIKEYEIYRNGTKIGTSPSTKYTDTGLQANTGYSYIVKAIDKKGNVSTASTEIKVKTKEKESEGTTTWDVNKIYTAGDRILFNGNEYEAMYWTKGDQPDISDVWKLLGDKILEWNALKAYQGGEKVRYRGITYQAKWWTKGNIPGQASVWEKIN